MSYQLEKGTPNDVVEIDYSEISGALSSVNFSLSIAEGTYSPEDMIITYIGSIYNSFNSLKEAWDGLVHSAVNYGGAVDSVPDPEEPDGLTDFDDEEDENPALEILKPDNQAVPVIPLGSSEEKPDEVGTEKPKDEEENPEQTPKATAEPKPQPESSEPPKTEPQPDGENQDEVYKVLTPNGGNLNVRAGAGTDNQIYTSIKNGTELKIKKEEGNWMQVEYQDQNGNTKTGYVYKDYVTKTSTPSQTVKATQGSAPSVSSTTNLNYKVKTLKGGNLNLRAGAGSDNQIYTTIKNGTDIKVVGFDGNWAKVQYQDKNGNNLTGYVYKEYITPTKD